MNKLKGEITEITTFGEIMLVQITIANKLILNSVVIESHDTTTDLVVGNSVGVLFKETEVFIAKESSLAISIENQISCKIDAIKTGELFSQLDMKCEGFLIQSIITTRSMKQLGLQVSDNVIALIKTNEISLLFND